MNWNITENVTENVMTSSFCSVLSSLNALCPQLVGESSPLQHQPAGTAFLQSCFELYALYSNRKHGFLFLTWFQVKLMCLLSSTCTGIYVVLLGARHILRWKWTPVCFWLLVFSVSNVTFYICTNGLQTGWQSTHSWANYSHHKKITPQ